MNITIQYTNRVEIPEWKSGHTLPDESPAAYAIDETRGQQVTVVAEFGSLSTFPVTVEVKADGGGVLGALPPEIVHLHGGPSGPVHFKLVNHTIGARGIEVQNITWNWKWRPVGATQWQNLRSTNHRIYVVLKEPTGSWQQGADYTQYPWTKALDYACSSAWAGGNFNAPGAAGSTTRTVNMFSGLRYDIARGASVYTAGNGPEFYLSAFLMYLDGAWGNGNIVNCTDCASIVTTFSNLVGCDLHASTMGKGRGFKLTDFDAIGPGSWGVPFNGSFSYHEVAWTGAGGSSDNIYDACLKVDGDSDPWNAPHTGLLPVNMNFTMAPGAALPIPVPFTLPSYRERLCSNDANGIGRCNSTSTWPHDGTGGRRRVV